MLYYGVEDPYNLNYRYYEQELLALWNVPAEFVVHTMDWVDIRSFNSAEWWQQLSWRLDSLHPPVQPFGN
jgi:hypothetical protein